MPRGEWTRVRTGEMAHRRPRAGRELVERVEGHLVANLLAVDLRRIGTDVHVRVVYPRRIGGRYNIC